MEDDLQLGKLKENCLLLKLYRKLRKMFLSLRKRLSSKQFSYANIHCNIQKNEPHLCSSSLGLYFLLNA